MYLPFEHLYIFPKALPTDITGLVKVNALLKESFDLLQREEISSFYTWLLELVYHHNNKNDLLGNFLRPLFVLSHLTLPGRRSGGD